MIDPFEYIYLASRSPRRRELLKQIGLHFEVVAPETDETPFPGEKPEDYVVRAAKDKARAAWEHIQEHKLPPHPVLAADTTVALGDEIFGKPESDEHAAQILRRLSGTTHRVLTAVAVAYQDKLEWRLSTTQVEFAPLSDHDIQLYVLTGEPHDKAGAYGIQGHGARFIRRIDGSYSGVMGLPLFETTELLNAIGMPA